MKREQCCAIFVYSILAYIIILVVLYNNHVNTYEKVCDKHDLHLIPLAFDTLGRMHPDSAELLHNAFIKHRLDSTKELLPHATPCGVGWVERLMPLCPQRCCVPAGVRPVLHAAPLGHLAPWLPVYNELQRLVFFYQVPAGTSRES